MATSDSSRFWRIGPPLAALIGTILTVYSLRFLIWHPFSGPLPGMLSLLVAVVGFVVGLGLLGWGLFRLDLIRVTAETDTS